MQNPGRTQADTQSEPVSVDQQSSNGFPVSRKKDLVSKGSLGAPSGRVNERKQKK